MYSDAERMFLLGVIVFAIASVGCGLAANIRDLVIARSVQGLERRFSCPAACRSLVTSFSEGSRGRAHRHVVWFYVNHGGCSDRFLADG